MKKLSVDKQKRLRQLLEEGLTQEQIAQRLDIGVGTVRRYRDKFGKSKVPRSKLRGITGKGATLPRVRDEAAFLPPAS